MKTIFKITILLCAFILSTSTKLNAQSTGATNTYNAANYLGWGATSGDLSFKVNNSTKMTLKNTSGNFGIGGTSPNNLFEVTGGDIDVETSTKGYMIDDAYVLRTGGNIYNIFVGWAAGAFNTTGTQNTFVGPGAGFANTTGSNNSFIGYGTGVANTTASDNTFLGYNSGTANTTGNHNSFGGSKSGEVNTTGSGNTFFGYASGSDNTTGYGNTAYGDSSLPVLTTGHWNVAIGYHSLKACTGDGNVGVGREALLSNTTGTSNTGIGTSALYKNTTGVENTGVGILALGENIDGWFNTALGDQALLKNTYGWGSTASGGAALWNNTTGDYNTANGYLALFENTTLDYNTALGYYAFYAGSAYTNSTALGYSATISASNQVRVGDPTSTSSIGGRVGWTNLSDSRFKKEVKETVPGLSFITKLRPVTYYMDLDKLSEFLHTPDSIRLKEGEALSAKSLETGFIAQEVEKVANEIGYDFNGVDKPKNENDYYGLRYGTFVVPLVKAVQELSATVDSLRNALANTSNAKLEGEEEPKATSIALNSAARDLPLLAQNQPNPFSVSTLLRFYLPKGTKGASIKVYDINGSVYRLFALTGEGPGTVEIEANTLNSGNYFYSLIIDGSVIDTKTMAITK